MGNSRHAQRQLAFQTLYSMYFTPVATLEELKALFESTPDAAETEHGQPAAGSAPAKDASSEPAAGTADNTKNEPAGNAHPEHVRKAQDLAWRIVRGVWENQSRIDDLITEVANRSMSRIGRIEQVILRMASFEMMTTKPGEIKIPLSEAVILSEEFGDARSRQFINGLLNGISRMVLEKGMTLKA